MLSAAALAFAMASCGSRTGLFGPEGASSGVSPQNDGSFPPLDAPSKEAPTEAPLPCVPGKFDLEAATAQLMFVIDRSRSMAQSLSGQDPPPAGQQSRWTILRNGLMQTILGFDNQIAMGAKFYPESGFAPQLQCLTENKIDIAPKLGNAQAIVSIFDQTSPLGGTPTADAIKVAADNLTKTRAVARTMVLATDGAPNCNFDHPKVPCVCTSASGSCGSDPDVSLCLDDTRTVNLIKSIADTEKVPTYVIGLGDFDRIEFRNTLDAMAVAGGRPRAGTPKYYSVQTPEDLDGALTGIRDSVAKCTFLTPSAPTDPDKITIEVNGGTILRDKTHTDGWDWADQAYGIVQFYGTACDKAQGKVTGIVTCQ